MSRPLPTFPTVHLWIMDPCTSCLRATDARGTRQVERMSKKCRPTIIAAAALYYNNAVAGLNASQPALKQQQPCRSHADAMRSLTLGSLCKNKGVTQMSIQHSFLVDHPCFIFFAAEQLPIFLAAALQISCNDGAH